MTLSYTRHLHLAVPDFLSEPWHAEFAAAMESIDSALFTTIIGANVQLWQTSHDYVIGDLVIDPLTGTLYASSEIHTSSRPTFAEEIAAFPTRWTSFAVDIASQTEAEQGIENSHYMTALRTAQAIDAQSPTPSVATQGQAEEGSDNVAMMTPLRTVQQITARIATQAEAEAGTNNTKLMTPLRVLQAIDAVGLPGGSQIAFSAHKNGVDQTGIANNIPTKVTFGTELYDLGSFYDTANSRWTPPAGQCHLDAAVFISAGLTTGQLLKLAIYKNGALFRESNVPTYNASQAGVQLSIDDVGTSTDYYELFVTLISVTTGTISGIVADTFFQGHFLGEVSTVVLGHVEFGFRAWKNGVAQTLSAVGTDQKVTFGTEIFDQGGYYEPTTSRWTPPTGMVHITARIGTPTSVAGNWFRAVIYKNGAPLAIGYHVGSSSDGTQVDVDDVASGTDYYEAFAFSTAGGTLFTDFGTYFCGHKVGGPQGDPGVAGPTGPSGTVSGIVVPPQGRLTLISNAPVMTTSITGMGTIRYTPYMGDRIPIYDGSGMVMVGFTELSQALSDSTKSPAAAVPETAYDLFVWVDTGVVRLSRGPAWAKTASVAISSPATPATVTWVNHGLHEGSAVVFTTTGTLPTGITAGTVYYVGRNVTATTFSIATSIQNAFLGTYVATTGTTQSGAHTGTNSDTVRGTGTGTTELTRVKGMLVNAFGISHGPLANQGTFVGTIRTNAAGTVDWQYGSTAVGGGTAFHNVWNCYNQKEVAGVVQEGTGSWGPSNPSTYNPLNRSTGNRVNIMIGLAEEPVIADNHFNGYPDTGSGWMLCGVGFDSTLIASGTQEGKHIGAGWMYGGWEAKAVTSGALGYHYWQALEYNAASTVITVIWGNTGQTPPGQQGLHYRTKM